MLLLQAGDHETWVPGTIIKCLAWILYLHFHHCWKREGGLPAGLLSHNDSHPITEITSQEEKKMEGHKQNTQHPALSPTCKFPGQNAITFMQYTLTKHMQHSRNTVCVCVYSCTHNHTHKHTTIVHTHKGMSRKKLEWFMGFSIPVHFYTNISNNYMQWILIVKC